MMLHSLFIPKVMVFNIPSNISIIFKTLHVYRNFSDKVMLLMSGHSLN